MTFWQFVDKHAEGIGGALCGAGGLVAVFLLIYGGSLIEAWKQRGRR